MATQPIRHVYNECKRFQHVRHYQIEKEHENDLLTSTINISKNRLFNKSKDALYFLKVRNGNKWNSTNTSGLLKTSNPLIFYGDIATQLNGIYKKTHLLVFVFNRGGSELEIYIYNRYYPKNTEELQKIISKYTKLF
jgi:hypothetical protein